MSRPKRGPDARKIRRAILRALGDEGPWDGRKLRCFYGFVRVVRKWQDPPFFGNNRPYRMRLAARARQEG